MLVSGSHTCLRSWRSFSTVYSDGCISSLGTRLGVPHSRFGELRQRTNLHSWLTHLPPPVPCQVLTVLLFTIQVSWPLGARLHRARIFLFISLFSMDTQPTSQCVQKQKTAGMGPLKKKKEEEREFTSFEHLHVWVSAWILAHGSSTIIQPLGHRVFYPYSHGAMMCRGVKLCPHSSD